MVMGHKRRAVAIPSRKAIAIATATNSMPWVCAAVDALRMPTAMAFATTVMHAWGKRMLAEYATVQERCTIVVAVPFRKAIAIATALQMLMAMAFAIRLTIALEHWMLQVRAMARVRQMPMGMAFAMTMEGIRATVLWMRAVCATDRA